MWSPMLMVLDVIEIESTYFGSSIGSDQYSRGEEPGGKRSFTDASIRSLRTKDKNDIERLHEILKSLLANYFNEKDEAPWLFVLNGGEKLSLSLIGKYHDEGDNEIQYHLVEQDAITNPSFNIQVKVDVKKEVLTRFGDALLPTHTKLSPRSSKQGLWKSISGLCPFRKNPTKYSSDKMSLLEYRSNRHKNPTPILPVRTLLNHLLDPQKYFYRNVQAADAIVKNATTNQTCAVGIKSRINFDSRYGTFKQEKCHNMDLEEKKYVILFIKLQGSGSQRFLRGGLIDTENFSLASVFDAHHKDTVRRKQLKEEDKAILIEVQLIGDEKKSNLNIPVCPQQGKAMRTNVSTLQEVDVPAMIISSFSCISSNKKQQEVGFLNANSNVFTETKKKRAIQPGQYEDQYCKHYMGKADQVDMDDPPSTLSCSSCHKKSGVKVSYPSGILNLKEMICRPLQSNLTKYTKLGKQTFLELIVNYIDNC
ncbi:hypothetical protein K2173_008872 [Erythroxylum novogranatense]|uniref:Uncharacterized protein n=1 Tax=Erythroxylum novogranatense TaxID=1862640 RepID=A0AAV8UCH9_9ROSI|nr:hypothetical protein K2173_008872 [Erythroxylum novogranatense]